MTRKTSNGICPDHYKVEHDLLMSGSFWFFPNKIDTDFYSALN